MAEDYNTKKSFEFLWTIENFNFCWHKTGECLESPLFWMDYQTTWRLCLYPRGEYDGEYVSCYLLREEGGPDIVNVDFELFLTVGEYEVCLEKPPVFFSKIYLFEIFQREGLACFASRRDIFVPKAAQKERFNLTFGCRIFKVNENTFDQKLHSGRTTIVTQRISGTEVFDDPTDLEPENRKDLDVKPLLQEDPLIGISVSRSHESLVIKIHPKSCHQIKYAICKITLISKWTIGSQIEYVRCWIGKIQAHIWRCKAPYKEIGSLEPSFEFIPSNALILHYDFAFPTGDEVVWNSLMDPHGYSKTPNFTLSEYLDLKVNTTECITTALATLKTLRTSKSYADRVIEIGNATFSYHEALLFARSINPPSEINTTLPMFSKFLMFLYTDTVEDLTFENAVELYRIGFTFKVELLQYQCRLYITDNLHFYAAATALQLADECQDLSMKAIVESYIITHFDLVYETKSWYELSKKYKKLARKTHLLQYIKKDEAFKLNQD